MFSGGRASGFKNVRDHDTYDVDGTRLFRIRGTCAEDVRATQMPEVAASLASDDAFILETPKVTYIWYGKGASEFERSMAKSVAKTLSPDHEIVYVNEESEPAGFWSSLGGKGNYDREIDPAGMEVKFDNSRRYLKRFILLGAPFLEPRLFHCTIRTNGKFRVEEIANFAQDDLDPDDIMVLDGGDEVYVWVGNGSTAEEKAKSIDMAKVRKIFRIVI